MLQKIQKIVNDESLTAEEKDKKMQVISQALYSGGHYTIQLAGYADTTVGAMATATTAGTMGL